MLQLVLLLSGPTIPVHHRKKRLRLVHHSRKFRGKSHYIAISIEFPPPPHSPPSAPIPASHRTRNPVSCQRPCKHKRAPPPPAPGSSRNLLAGGASDSGLCRQAKHSRQYPVSTAAAALDSRQALKLGFFHINAR